MKENEFYSKTQVIKPFDPWDSPYCSCPKNFLLTFIQVALTNVFKIGPIFPFLNDDEIEEIVKKAKEVVVKHIVVSTFKPRLDSWKKFEIAFLKVAKKLKPQIQNLFCNLPEGFLNLKSAKSCDGNHLI